MDQDHDDQVTGTSKIIILSAVLGQNSGGKSQSFWVVEEDSPQSPSPLGKTLEWLEN